MKTLMNFLACIALAPPNDHGFVIEKTGHADNPKRGGDSHLTASNEQVGVILASGSGKIDAKLGDAGKSFVIGQFQGDANTA